MNLRTIAFSDYDQLIPFWRENYFVSEMDSAERFKLFLEKNPDLSVLIEENERIIGSALGSFDGRRGYIQKVVTSKELRKRGIGKQLMNEVIKRLRKLGVLYIPINVENELVGFYEKNGFKRTEQTPMSISFDK